MTKTQYQKYLIKSFFALNGCLWLSIPLLLLAISTNNGIAFIIWFIVVYFIFSITRENVREVSKKYRKNKRKE